MKKLLILMFGIIFIAGLVASATNTKIYDSNIKQVTITDYTKSKEIATIQLLTPLDNHVGLGYQKVAELQIVGKTDYTNFFNSMSFYDLKDNFKQVTRSYDFKVKVVNQVLVDDYSYIEIGTDKNGSKLYENKLIGNHIENKVTWTAIDLSSIKQADNLTIGIFTDVKKGDVIEWVPTIANVKINEFATWTADLNIGLIAYYKLDETSGTLAEDSLGAYNLTTRNSPNWVSVGCIINNCIQTFSTGTDSFLNYTGSLAILSGNKDYSISMWINATTLTDPMGILGNHILASPPYNVMGIGFESGKVFFRSINGTDNVIATTSNISANTLYHLVFIHYSNNTILLYENSLIQAGSTTGFTDTTGEFQIGNINHVTRASFDGQLDEIGIWNRTLNQTEINELYNNGSGIQYGQVGTVNITLNSPLNASNITTNTATLNASVDTSDGIYNISFYTNISGSWTNTSTTTYTAPYSYNLVPTYTTGALSNGTYLWNVYACDIYNTCNWSSGNYTFTVQYNEPKGIFYIDLSALSSIFVLILMFMLAVLLFVLGYNQWASYTLTLIGFLLLFNGQLIAGLVFVLVSIFGLKGGND